MKISSLLVPVILAMAGGIASAANAQSLNQGAYFRGELGGSVLATDSGYWWGPGGPPADPRITFSLNDAFGVTGSAGFGYDWANGLRADVSANGLIGMQVDGTFQSANDGTTVGHANDIHAPVTVLAVLANVFVEPMLLAGADSGFQPFLTGGVGLASVSTGQWTRNNPASPQPTRTWEGANQTNFAWTLGAGVSIDLQGLTGGEGKLDLTYRYTDYGAASGGSAAVNPPPAGQPTEPFNFRLANSRRDRWLQNADRQLSLRALDTLPRFCPFGRFRTGIRSITLPFRRGRRLRSRSWKGADSRFQE